VNTHTPLEDNKSSKNNGEDPSRQPLGALIDVNVERSPRHIMSVNTIVKSLWLKRMVLYFCGQV
jgi:hypothetical protein